MIVPEGKGFSVRSEEGKNLGGPYATREEAQKRLAQVEAFKNISEKLKRGESK